MVLGETAADVVDILVESVPRTFEPLAYLLLLLAAGIIAGEEALLVLLGQVRLDTVEAVRQAGLLLVRHDGPGL